MTPLLHIICFFGLLEIIITINGTVWISNALHSTCAKSIAEQNSMYVILGLIVSKWIGIFISLLLILLSMKDLWPICCCHTRSNGERGDIYSREEAIKKIFNHFTDPGECCFYMFKRCCVATKQVEYFNDIADLINDMFADEAFVPTDIAAALILLSTQTEVNPNDQPIRSMKNKSIHLKNLEDYLAYSSASYGCAMYLFDNENRFEHLSNLCRNISCCSCCCIGKKFLSSKSLLLTFRLSFSGGNVSRQEFIEEDNCCFCFLATLNLRLPHIEETDIIHISNKNNFLETPFLIVADSKLQKLVISIRGTLSLADLMTDMVAKPISLKEFLLKNVDDLQLSPQELEQCQNLDPEIEVHGGMAEAALYIYKTIKSKHFLDMAHVQYPDYPLVVTGHSLGAGTAVILAFMLRLRYSNIKCFAFGPPGGLLSLAASKVNFINRLLPLCSTIYIICMFVFYRFLLNSLLLWW